MFMTSFRSETQAEQETELNKLVAAVEAAEADSANAARQLEEAQSAHEAQREQMAEAAAADEAQAQVQAKRADSGRHSVKSIGTSGWRTGSVTASVSRHLLVLYSEITAASRQSCRLKTQFSCALLFKAFEKGTFELDLGSGHENTYR